MRLADVLKDFIVRAHHWQRMHACTTYTYVIYLCKRIYIDVGKILCTKKSLSEEKDDCLPRSGCMDKNLNNFE